MVDLRVAAAGLLLVLAGCAQPAAEGDRGDGDGFPPLIQPEPLVDGLVIASATFRQDADGFVASMRLADRPVKNWTAAYGIEIYHWVPFDGEPGFAQHLLYEAGAQWDERAKAWNASASAADRRCADCRNVPPVSVQSKFEEKDGALTWRIAYADPAHAGLAYEETFLVFRMDDGGCFYDRWPVRGVNREVFCATRRGAAVPLDAGAVTHAMNLTGLVSAAGPRVARWAVDGDQGAIDLHFGAAAAALDLGGPEEFAGRRLVAVLALDDRAAPPLTYWIEVRNDGFVMHVQGMVVREGPWASVDTRGSRSVGDVLHLQWTRLEDDGVAVRDSGDAALSFVLDDPHRTCHFARHGAWPPGWDESEPSCASLG